MAEFADRVLKLVSEPDYKPITLKAMSRHFEVPADEYAEFRATVKRLVREGKLDLAKDKTLRRPERAGLVVGTVPPDRARASGLSARTRRRPRTTTSIFRSKPRAMRRAATRSPSRSPSERGEKG